MHQKKLSMRNIISHKIVLLTLLVIRSLNISGQTEYLVTVDPTTGVISKIDSLPGVKLINTSPNYTVFDETNKRFIFRGGDNIGNRYLYSVDAITGNIISSPSFPVLDTLDNIIELQYDNVSNTMYGLHWDNSETREYFVSVNPTDGSFTIIDSIPSVKWITPTPKYTAFDETNHRYIFKGASSILDWRLYSLDAITGSVISNPLFPNLADPLDNIIELQYDNSSNTMYALHWDNSENREYFVSVNPTDGSFTIIDSLPGVNWVSTDHTTFDEINQRYIFRGGDVSGSFYLYSIDAITGSVVSNPLFPILNDPLDNVIELNFDNSSGNLYALHWENDITTNIQSNIKSSIFELYPNPFSTNSVIILDKIYSEVRTFLYNSSGQVVKSQLNYNSSSINFNRDDLASGIYYISVVCDHQNQGMKKIIIQ